VACVRVTSLSVKNSCRDQLFHKWNSTEALVFRVEQWNSVLLFLHQLWSYFSKKNFDRRKRYTASGDSDTSSPAPFPHPSPQTIIHNTSIVLCT
jgi:hypothetical protein